MNKSDILIVCALEQEVNGKLDGVLPDPRQIIYTGVGKVNATGQLTERLHTSYLSFLPEMPKLVINYGTAGSIDLPIGELVDCTKFIQRDMDVTPLGFQNYETPWGNRNISFLTTTLDGISCGTGDSFVMAPDPWFVTADIDCVDMEGYALAYVAQQYGIPFRSFKYISDMADENAADEWANNVAAGAEQFLELYANL